VSVTYVCEQAVLPGGQVAGGRSDDVAQQLAVLGGRELEPRGKRHDRRDLAAGAFGRPDEADLVDILRANGKATLSLVAVEDDCIVGHILFSPVTIKSGERTCPAVGLAPMAVLPGRQRHGIGGRLVKAGLVECRNSGYDCMVVLGHPTYYPRFGFVPASRYGLKSEYEVPDEAFMILAWQEGMLKDRGGVARYQPEFRRV
jgi:putative acetyltransferase